MTSIRTATNADRDRICDVHLRAFPDGEGQSIAALAASLLDEKSDPETITLVAETDGKIVGHIAFSPVTSDTDPGWRGYLLAPLGVRPDCQNRRVGSMLIRQGLARLADSGVSLVFVYGDPNYYGRFGFRPETATGYVPPYQLQYPFGWQALALNTQGAGAQETQISCVSPLCDPTLW